MKPLKPKVTISLHLNSLSQNISLNRVWGQLGNQILCISSENDHITRYYVRY